MFGGPRYISGEICYAMLAAVMWPLWKTGSGAPLHCSIWAFRSPPLHSDSLRSTSGGIPERLRTSLVGCMQHGQSVAETVEICQGRK